MTTLRSPLRGRYLVQNRLWNTWLRGSDALLDLLGASTDRGIPASPRRLLLAVGGHLGDAVIATSVLAGLRGRWPDVEIGILTGSWNRQVFAGLAEVKWIHVADHWKLNRSPNSLLSRASHSAATSGTAVREIMQVGYDIAVDLYPYYPNAGAVLRRARIPVRVGYTSGGGGAHYTRRIDWKDEGHVTNDHRRLMALLGVDMPTVSYRLPPITAAAQELAKRVLRSAGVNADRYVVLHTGAGNPVKQWPVQEWKALASTLSQKEFSVVLTGAGLRDRELTRALAENIPKATDLCDRLDWNAFAAVLASARAVVSIDTVAAHLSAGMGVPTVVVATGTEAPGRWTPLGKEVVVLSERVECSPCYQAQGCASMECIRNVTADRVTLALTPFLQ